MRSALTRILRVHTDERAWRIGADGEEKVAARLEKLVRKDSRWRFLHAVPVGERGSDIDHVAIGPAGVFTINTKHHPGAKVWVGGNTVMVDGRRVPYVRNSRHEATRAARLLTAACDTDVPASALIVPVGAGDLVVKEQPQDVTVVARMQLARWLAGRPTVLSDEQIVRVFDVARRSSTWV